MSRNTARQRVQTLKEWSAGIVKPKAPPPPPVKITHEAAAITDRYGMVTIIEEIPMGHGYYKEVKSYVKRLTDEEEADIIQAISDRSKKPMIIYSSHEN